MARTEIRELVGRQADQPVTLVSRVWFAWLVTPWFGVGGSYRHPHGVETGGSDPRRIPIRDHVMEVKLIVAVALAIAALIRMFGR